MGALPVAEALAMMLRHTAAAAVEPLPCTRGRLFTDLPAN